MTDTTSTEARTETAALEVRGLGKTYGPVRALQDVSFSLHRGEVLALLGDNGAGKSTLVKCVSGAVVADSGEILVEGERVTIRDPDDARDCGIETVHQDLALVEHLDIAGNVYLNREIYRSMPLLRAIGWLDKAAMRKGAREKLERLRINIPSMRQPVAKLSGGQRQSIAVGRAVAWGQHIVMMDEPVAALGVEQSRVVLELVRELRNAGVAVLLISHNMQDVIDHCDRAVVLRHGRKVGDVRIADVSGNDLVAMITGVSD